MAVDPKTGKPVVVDAGWGEIARDLAGALEWTKAEAKRQP